MLVDCKHLVKTFGPGDAPIRAVDGVSLRIDQGESVALMGKSGSGKTTLLHLLALIDQPDSGEYYFLGRNVLELNKRQLLSFRRTKVAVIFQNYNLLHELTAKENLFTRDACNVDFWRRVAGVL